MRGAFAFTSQAAASSFGAAPPSNQLGKPTEMKNSSLRAQGRHSRRQHPPLGLGKISAAQI